MKSRSAALWCGLFLLFSAEATRPYSQTVYKTPPRLVEDLLDRESFPQVEVGPRGQWLLLVRRAGLPRIAELSQPRVHLAGKRFNPLNRGPVSDDRGRIVGFRLLSVADASEHEIEAPEGGQPALPLWSPDGRKIAFVNFLDTGAELWVADVENGKSKRVSGPTLNLASGPCRWLPDSDHLLCRFRVETAEGLPVSPIVPAGPTVQETTGERAPARTYRDLLASEQDVRQYEYLLRSQPALVSVKTGRRRDVGSAGLFGKIEVSPGGQYLLVERVTPPYSFLVPEEFFPREVEVWDLMGKKVAEIASLPLAEGIPIGGVRTGPRDHAWEPSSPATLVWREALDGGDPKQQASHRDRLMKLAAPFEDGAVEVIRTQWRLSDLKWLEDGSAFVSEFDRDSQYTRTWYVAASAEPGKPAHRLVWQRDGHDAYHDPGSLVMVHDPHGDPIVLRDGKNVFLTGKGSSPEGDHPFLDRLSLDTLSTVELFRSERGAYERVVTVLDSASPVILTCRETAQEPPSYRVRDLSGGEPRVLTSFPDPAPELRGIRKELITYWREDGVELSGMLYLPPGFHESERLPLVMWAYPREYNDPDVASQVRGSSNRFLRLSGPSQLFFLTQGYAVLDGPAMPIVGEHGNDTFVEQLVMNARAAIDKVVAMGVADPQRIGIGGHSYGAFMAANLLAHSDLFAAGIARSGAYNRTLTPFGFQNERRTLWEVPEVYFTMSPFMHADRLNEPILLIHGQDDDNSGTFPIQSERFFRAIQGLGGTARLVLLPRESHHYAARESVLDTLAEMIEWFDRYVKHRGEQPPEPE
ncbi:MAG: prolyl oligopeptidase family serine peptidase [Acidobacteriota bacterium]